MTQKISYYPGLSLLENIAVNSEQRTMESVATECDYIISDRPFELSKPVEVVEDPFLETAHRIKTDKESKFMVIYDGHYMIFQGLIGLVRAMKLRESESR